MEQISILLPKCFRNLYFNVSVVEIRKNNLSSHFNKCDYFIVENDQTKLNLTIFWPVKAKKMSGHDLWPALMFTDLLTSVQTLFLSCTPHWSSRTSHLEWLRKLPPFLLRKLNILTYLLQNYNKQLLDKAIWDIDIYSDKLYI